MEMKNPGYTIQLCQGLLKTLPEFLDARKLARRAATEKAKMAKKGFFSGLGGGSSLALMKASGLLKKQEDLAQLLILLEEILAEDPYNEKANLLLHEASLKWEPPMKELAMYALETLVEGNPKNIEQLHRAASFCMEKDESGSPRDPSRAVELFNKILAINPNDLAAIKGERTPQHLIPSRRVDGRLLTAIVT